MYKPDEKDGKSRKPSGFVHEILLRKPFRCTNPRYHYSCVRSSPDTWRSTLKAANVAAAGTLKVGHVSKSRRKRSRCPQDWDICDMISCHLQRPGLTGGILWRFG